MKTTSLKSRGIILFAFTAVLLATSPLCEAKKKKQKKSKRSQPEATEAEQDTPTAKWKGRPEDWDDVPWTETLKIPKTGTPEIFSEFPEPHKCAICQAVTWQLDHALTIAETKVGRDPSKPLREPEYIGVLEAVCNNETLWKYAGHYVFHEVPDGSRNIFLVGPGIPYHYPEGPGSPYNASKCGWWSDMGRDKAMKSDCKVIVGGDWEDEELYRMRRQGGAQALQSTVCAAICDKYGTYDHPKPLRPVEPRESEL